VVFIVLKLVGVIGWSWWWVLAPFWGSLALGLVAVALLALVAAASAGGRR
jgi:phosphoglycerol transferase MdoB-like AlkP superfamily enzyme